VPVPPRLQLSAESLCYDGAYLADAGSRLVLFVREGVSPAWLQDALCCASFAALPPLNHGLRAAAGLRARPAAGQGLPRPHHCAEPMVQGLYTVPARRSRVTGGCTRVALTDARACGAAVHEVLSLLQLPPKGTVADQLQDQDAFTIFSKMTRDSSLGAAYQDPSSALTVLAPRAVRPRVPHAAAAGARPPYFSLHLRLFFLLSRAIFAFKYLKKEAKIGKNRRKLSLHLSPPLEAKVNIRTPLEEVVYTCLYSRCYIY